MKRFFMLLLPALFVLSGCVSAARQDELTATAPALPGSNAEEGTSSMPSAFDLQYDFHLKDGEYYEIPGASREEAEAYRIDGDVEKLRTRLDGYGVQLSLQACEILYPMDAKVDFSMLPMFLIHYQDFDLLYVRYPGYRGSDTGNLYVFESNRYKGSIMEAGDVDWNGCFRQEGDRIWLVITRHSGGSGLGMQYQQWINLRDEQLSMDLQYTNRYSSTNDGYDAGFDFTLLLVYQASEAELYRNEQDITVLKVNWSKEVSDLNQLIGLATDGSVAYTVQARDGVDFNPYDLACGNLVDGLEEQLYDLIAKGTAEEKHIAEQIAEHFVGE